VSPKVFVALGAEPNYQKTERRKYAMINEIFGELVPNMDVEPIDPGCSCGCQCTTKAGASSTAGSAFDRGQAA